MEVEVQYAAQLKSRAGTAREKVCVPGGTTVRGLLEHLASKHGQPFRELVFREDGSVRPSVLVFMGDKQIGKDLERPLEEGAELLLLSPVAGG